MARRRSRSGAGRVAWRTLAAESGDESIVRRVAEPFSEEGGLKLLTGNCGFTIAPAESHDVASGCESAEGVVYVPALLGLTLPALALPFGRRKSLLDDLSQRRRHFRVQAIGARPLPDRCHQYVERMV